MPNDKNELSKNWIDFRNEVVRRLKYSLGHPSFIFYFVAFIFIIGNLSAWISIYNKNWSNVPKDLSTYLIAISASAAADLLLSESLKRSMQLFALLMLVLTGILAFLGQRPSFCLAIIGTLLAWFMWWIANADNRKLFEPSPPVDAVTGGNPEDIQGNLNDIIAE